MCNRPQSTYGAYPSGDLPSGGPQINRYLYVTTEGFPPTVFDSQVLEYIHLMEDRGINFDLVVFERILDVPCHRKRTLSRFREVKSRLKGRLYYRVLFTTFVGLDLWIPRLQLFLILRRVGRVARIIIHARSHTSGLITLGMKSWFPNLRVVLDIRGDSAAEYMLATRELAGELRSFWIRTKYARLKAIEKYSVTRADEIICVSEVMKAKLESEYPATKAPISVIPTVANSREFCLNFELREQARNELHLHEEFVLGYSGSLRRYQSVGEMILATRTLIEKGLNVHLIMITPEVVQGRQLLQESLPTGSYSIISAIHYEVAKWLNAADAGWLLRESNPVNKVAAPTKFAEYLLCGLPVIMTAEIGDYSALALRERLGVVLKDLSSFDDLFTRWEELQQLAQPASRQRIARLASKYFDLHQIAGTLERIYRGVR